MRKGGLEETGWEGFAVMGGTENLGEGDVGVGGRKFLVVDVAGLKHFGER